MLTTLGIVQVGLGGKREDAPGSRASLAGRSLGGKSLLEWVVRRVTESQQLGGVIALLGPDPEDRRLAEFVPPDVPVFTSERPDPLARFAAALSEFPAEAIVRVCLDNPFIDPALIDRLVITAADHPRCDYISYCSSDGHPSVQSKVGVFAEWCRAKAILRADRTATHPADRQEVTRYIYSHPELFQLRLISAPPLLDRDDVRLTISGEDDWDHAQTIYEALGPEDLDWQRIAGLLDQHPALRERMAVLNRADATV